MQRHSEVNTNYRPRFHMLLFFCMPRRKWHHEHCIAQRSVSRSWAHLCLRHWLRQTQSPLLAALPPHMPRFAPRCSWTPTRSSASSLILPLGCLPFENLRAGESPRRQDYDSILLTVCSWPGIYAGLCMIYAWCMLKSLRPYATYMPPVSRGYAGRKPAACRR